MTLITMTALLIGATLGLRFKVMVLVPTIIMGSAATFGIGMAQSNSQGSILLAVAATITALQLGYFGGAVIGSRKKPVKQFAPARARQHSQ